MYTPGAVGCGVPKGRSNHTAGDDNNWVTEMVEDFAINAAGQARQKLIHDRAGNMTYDGLHKYVYDAWPSALRLRLEENRLAKVRRAWGNPNDANSPQTGSGVATIAGSRHFLFSQLRQDAQLGQGCTSARLDSVNGGAGVRANPGQPPAAGDGRHVAGPVWPAGSKASALRSARVVVAHYAGKIGTGGGSECSSQSLGQAGLGGGAADAAVQFILIPGAAGRIE